LDSELRFTEKQQRFAEAALSGRYKYLLFGGAIRGGKSVCALTLIILLCRMYPGSRWAVVRKDLPTLRRNTIPTFEQIKPRGFVGEINKTIWTVQCANGSEILFFPESIKDDPDLDRWKGLEVNGFKLGEANELSESSFSKAIERAGSWKCPGDKQPPPIILATCNPAKNWVKRTFYDPWRLGKLFPPFYFLPARPGENPHNTQEYMESLEQLRVTDPRAYARFVEGDWESADDPDQLIKYEWILSARDVERVPGKRKLGIDIGRAEGGDDTVICHVEGNAITELEYFNGMRLDRQAEIIQARINDGPVDASNVMIDAVGIGAGVADILTGQELEVTAIISGKKMPPPPDSFYRFDNLRSQMWWGFRERLRRGEICIDVQDSRLFEDLTAPHYRVKGDKELSVESKDTIKTRIGRSTDAGDAAVYAFAELDDDGFGDFGDLVF